MFGSKCKSQRRVPSCGMTVSDVIPSILHGALLAAGALAIGSFVYKKIRKMNKDKLCRDMRECREDVVAFAQDVCDEVCDCMTDDDCDTSCGCEDC